MNRLPTTKPARKHFDEVSKKLVLAHTGSKRTAHSATLSVLNHLLEQVIPVIRSAVRQECHLCGGALRLRGVGARRSLLVEASERPHQKTKFSPSQVLPETQSDCAALSAFQAAPRKTIITENSIHTIKPIAAATPL